MYKKIFFRSTTHLNKLPYQHLLHIPTSFRSLSTSKIIPPYTPLSLKQNISVRNMTEKDLELVFQWSEKERWNPGKHEVKPLFAADPKGYYLLEVDGEPTASLSAIKYSQKLAFLGLFVVVPHKRGQGFGSMLWDVVTRKLEMCSTIGLNGTMQQIGRYEKSGFRSNFQNTRWRGKPANIPKENNIKTDKLVLSDTFSTKALVEYHNRIFSTPRDAFLEQWLKMPESHTLAAMDKQGNIIGYGVISRTVETNSFKIAPLYANSESTADQLYRSLCSFVGRDATVSIDITEKNPYASVLIERFKLEKMFDTMRMYKGEAPVIDQEKIVGVTALEMGS